MKKKLLFGLAAALLTFSSGAQSQFSNRGITFKGNVTQGHCPSIVDAFHLQDSGAACGTGGSTSPGGSNSDVQFNSTGVFGGNAGFTYDGVSGIGLGVTGTSNGLITLYNSTSGKIGLTAPAGALGSALLTLPDVTDTLAGVTAPQTLANKTLTSPNINGGWLSYTNAGSNSESFGTAGTGAPGTAAGEKIQLYGTSGTPSTGDYSIGINASEFWENIANSAVYSWYVAGNKEASLNSSGLFTAQELAAQNLSTAGVIWTNTGGLLQSEATITPSQCPVGTTSAIGCLKPDGTTLAVAGDGTLSVRAGNVPGGGNNEVQVNVGGAFTGSSNFTYGSLTGSLLLAQGTNNINAPSLTFRNTSGQSTIITVNLSAPLGSHNLFLPALSADDTFATLGAAQTFSTTQTISIPNISFDGTAGLNIFNPTAAASNTTQASPRVRLQGNGWSTNLGASQPVEFDLQTRPVDGTTISGSLSFLSLINGGSESQIAALSNGGLFFTIGGLETLGNLQFDGASTDTITFASPQFNIQRGANLVADLDAQNYLSTGGFITSNTSFETPASNQIQIAGNVSALPTLTASAVGLIFTSGGGGLKFEGNGASNDMTFVNSSPNNVAWIPHGSTIFNVQNLAIVGQGVGILNVIDGSGTVQSIPGATCTGVPSINFAITNGIVTHC